MVRGRMGSHDSTTYYYLLLLLFICQEKKKMEERCGVGGGMKRGDRAWKKAERALKNMICEGIRGGSECMWEKGGWQKEEDKGGAKMCFEIKMTTEKRKKDR